MLGVLYWMVGAAVAAAHGLALLLSRLSVGPGDPERVRRLRERLGRWDGHAGSTKPWIWIHGASVGEAKIALALAEALLAKLGETRLVVSSTTATGRAVGDASGCVESRYFPIDYMPLVKRLVRPFPPRLFVAVETEIWPATLGVLEREGVPVAFVNARLSDRSLPRYRLFRVWLAPLLRNVALVCARDDESRRRWMELGARPDVVEVTGDLKFDLTAAAGGARKRLEPGWIDDGKVLLAASTHDGEEAVALEAFAAALAVRADLRLVLAPRHPERAAAVVVLARRSGRRVAAWSEGRTTGAEVVVLDRLGLLDSAYSQAVAAFVGGSLVAGPGGHNLLEPIAAGCPVATGPLLANVPEQAEALAACGALTIVADADALSKFWLDVIEKPEEFAAAVGFAREAVEVRRGALARTVAALLPLIEAKVSG